MSSSLAFWLFDLMSRMPLSLLHLTGVIAGWITYWTSSKYAERLRENLLNAYKNRTNGHGRFPHPNPDGATSHSTKLANNASQVAGYPPEGEGANESLRKFQDDAEFRQLLKANVGEVGKGAAELPWMWRRPLEQVVASVKACHGWELVEAARQQGKGLIMLTPHIGCFEVIALYVSSRMPMTVMYRVPKLAWLDKVMREGRGRGQMKLARADTGGVRTLFKALKRGEVIGMLPDQVPGNGEGEWAPFFARPAYTMTLVGRLAEASGATILLSYSERLPQGAGYIIRITPLEFDSATPVTTQLNAALEEVIRACPAQYLWSYNRYKTPDGALPPNTARE